MSEVKIPWIDLITHIQQLVRDVMMKAIGEEKALVLIGNLELSSFERE